MSSSVRRLYLLVTANALVFPSVSVRQTIRDGGKWRIRACCCQSQSQGHRTNVDQSAGVSEAFHNLSRPRGENHSRSATAPMRISRRSRNNKRDTTPRHSASEFSYAGAELLILKIDLAAAAIAGQVRMVAKISHRLRLPCAAGATNNLYFYFVD